MSDGLYHAVFSAPPHLNAGAHRQTSALVCTRLAPIGHGQVPSLATRQRQPPRSNTWLWLRIKGAPLILAIFNRLTLHRLCRARILSLHHRLVATTTGVKAGKRTVVMAESVKVRFGQYPLSSVRYALASIIPRRFCWIMTASINDVGIRRHFSRPQADTLKASIDPPIFYNS